MTGHSVVMKPLRSYKHCGVVKSLGADCELLVSVAVNEDGHEV